MKVTGYNNYNDSKCPQKTFILNKNTQRNLMNVLHVLKAKSILRLNFNNFIFKLN